MKVLYYSTALYASHGGSLQSIEFYNSLNEIDRLESVEVFPKSLPSSPPSKLGAFLRRSLKKVPLLQIFFFYRRNRMYFTELQDYIKKMKPDVIVLQIDSNFLQIKEVKKKFPYLFVISQVNASPFDEPFKNIAFRKEFLRKQAYSYSKSDLNFFVSGILREQIMGRFLDENRDKVVHNGTDVSKFKPLEEKSLLRKKYSYPENLFLVGYVGTLDFHKKVGLLLHSIKEMEDKSIALVIIGDGPATESLKEEVVKLKIEKNVIFRGWIDHDLMNENLNCFDIAIHHHANEYMSPLKIFEYLASGLPVIAPNIPAVKEVFTNNVDLLLTEPKIDSITQNILNLRNDKERGIILAANGRKKVINGYTWEKYSNLIIEKTEEKWKNRI